MDVARVIQEEVIKAVAAAYECCAYLAEEEGGIDAFHPIPLAIRNAGKEEVRRLKKLIASPTPPKPLLMPLGTRQNHNK